MSKQVKETEKKISDLVERVMDASNARVISAYEKRIDQLETHKLVLAEKHAGMEKPRHTFEQLFELSMRLLSNPCILWEYGNFAMQRTVLKLAFSDHLSYCREKGFRTPKKSLAFRALGVISDQKNEMVHLRGTT